MSFEIKKEIVGPKNFRIFGVKFFIFSLKSVS
jgi:hypothetical protein